VRKYAVGLQTWTAVHESVELNLQTVSLGVFETQTEPNGKPIRKMGGHASPPDPLLHRHCSDGSVELWTDVKTRSMRTELPKNLTCELRTY